MNSSTHENQCKPLFEICLDIVTPKINLYAEHLSHLPEHVKFRILRRITKLNGIQNDIVMKSLIRPGLRMLNLSTSTVTDETLNILTQCKLMDRLTFNKANYQITPKGLMSLCPNLRFLTALYIAECDAVTDEVLETLKNGCVELRELDIGGCSVITNKGMQSLSSLQALSSLNISRTNVTDVGLKYLTSGVCKDSLCEVRMSCCRVTDIGVNAVTRNCPLLSTLICNDCDIKDLATTFQAWGLPMKQISWTINFDSPPLF